VEAVSRSAELDDALLARNRELHAAQYHEQVKVTPQSTPLFALAEGVRVPIHRAMVSSPSPRALSSAQLQRRIEVAPENFSANVLLRPGCRTTGPHAGLHRRAGRNRLLRKPGGL